MGCHSLSHLIEVFGVDGANSHDALDDALACAEVFCLGHECLSGVNLPRDYEKAYSCFIKGQDVDWVPIDPEENTDFEIEGEV